MRKIRMMLPENNGLGFFMALVACHALVDVGVSRAGCLECPGGTSEVSILLSGSDVAGSMWEVARDRWYNYNRPSELRNAGMWIVDTAYGLTLALKHAAQSCRRIKFLGIFSHGSPGSLYLGSGVNTEVSARNLSDLTAGLECAMASNATVAMAGCNTGRGCRGEDFIADVAKSLLNRGGGTVIANTFYASTPLPGLIPHTSLNFDRQVLTVGKGLSNPRWDNTPQTSAQCIETVKRARLELQEIKLRRKYCATTPEVVAQTHRIVRAESYLSAAEAHYSTLTLVGIRPQFTDAYRDGAKNMRTGMEIMSYVKRKDTDLPTCAHPVGSDSSSVPAAAGVGQ